MKIKIENQEIKIDGKKFIANAEIELKEIKQKPVEDVF